MTEKEKIELTENNPEALFCDGFDDAIIGMAQRINLGPVVAYDIEKIISIMMERDNMTYEEALEFFDFNIMGSWVGEFTPIYINKINNI